MEELLVIRKRLRCRNQKVEHGAFVCVQADDDPSRPFFSLLFEGRGPSARCKKSSSTKTPSTLDPIDLSQRKTRCPSPPALVVAVLHPEKSAYILISVAFLPAGAAGSDVIGRHSSAQVFELSCFVSFQMIRT